MNKTREIEEFCREMIVPKLNLSRLLQPSKEGRFPDKKTLFRRLKMAN